MGNAAGFILNLEAGRAEVLFDAANQDGTFPEVVADFEHGRGSSLACFVSVGGPAITHVGAAKRGVLPGVGLRRLNVGPLLALAKPVPHEALIEAAASRVRSHIAAKLRNGGLLAPATFAAVVDAILDAAPETAPFLARFGHQYRQRLERLKPAELSALAYQKDALATALAFAGIDRSPITTWIPPQMDERPASFLDGLAQMREREDSMVATDLTRMPGFDFIRGVAHGATVFENDRSRLTVVMANHLPLEQQLGADLIYFNETYRSFIIVQYKAMEGDGEDGAVYRFPDAQLTAELARMDAHLEMLRQCPPNANRLGYRMLENPFFLKLCPRMQFAPDSRALVKGMYLSLDYWRFIETDETMIGTRGGRLVSYKNIGRYLDNSAFIELVANAWIGTTVQQSDILEALIKEILTTGRTVTIALKSDKPPPEPPAEGSQWEPQGEQEEEPPLTVSLQ